MRASGPPRYRQEGGKTCLDIRLRSADQLFDGRDPAPFRERDLDADAVEYIVGAFEEFPPKAEAKIVFWIAEGPAQINTETLIEAVRAHFAYEVEKLNRRVRTHLRQGQIALGVGLVVLTVFLSMAQLMMRIVPEGTIQQILREGLVITGWVAMWRPLDVLLYDWWPLIRQRRMYARVLRTEIAVEHGRWEGAGPVV